MEYSGLSLSKMVKKKPPIPYIIRDGRFRVATQIAKAKSLCHLVPAIKGRPFDSSSTAPKVEGFLFAPVCTKHRLSKATLKILALINTDIITILTLLKNYSSKILKTAA